MLCRSVVTVPLTPILWFKGLLCDQDDVASRNYTVYGNNTNYGGSGTWFRLVIANLPLLSRKFLGETP